MDKFTKEKRSAIMRAIRGRDTQPELIVRKWLYAHGWRFRCQYKRVPGHPDIAIPKIRTLIEIRGCFWHRHEGCPTATMPKSNKAFWRTKFQNNVARDKRHEKEWAELGWNLIVIWECGLATLKERERTFRKVEKWLKEISFKKHRHYDWTDERRDVLSGFLQKRVSDIRRFGRKVDEKDEQSLNVESVIPRENVGVKSSSGSGLNASEQKAVLLILRNSFITEEEIANQLDVTIRQAERIIAALKKKAGLTRRGSDKAGEWYFDVVT